MKIRTGRKALGLALVAVAAVIALPRGAAAGCSQRCIAISTTCSRCASSPISYNGCVEFSPCSCVNVTCDPPAAAANQASADAALALLLALPDAQTGGQCTLQTPAALGG